MTWRKALTAPFRAAGRGLKSAMRWTGQARYWWQFILPRTKFDYEREVGDGTANSIVVACINWIARTFPEAPVMVVEEDEDGQLIKVPRHGFAHKMERPNPYYPGVLLWHATINDRTATGNAYWLKVRNRADKVIEYWYTPSWTMEPKWPDDGSEFISHYEYKPDPTKAADRWPVGDVVHFRHGIDPNNTRKGISPLYSVMREIFTDDESANMTAALVRNLGIPGVVIAPEGANMKVSDEAAQETKETFQAKFGGDRRGEPMIMKAPTKIQVLSFSPEQMQLKELRRIPEERVSAVLGVPAIVAGLGAGLDKATYDNVEKLVEFAVEQGIVPIQRQIAAELTLQALPDFDKDENRSVAFDLSKVRALQPDMDKLAERIDRLIRGGSCRVDVGQRILGLPVDDSQAIYLRPFTTVPVPAGQPPTPPPAPKGAKGLKQNIDFVAAIAAARKRLADAYGPQIREFFEAQAKRALGRLNDVVAVRSGNGAQQKQGIVGPKTLLPDEEDALLSEALRPLWLAGVKAAWDLAAESYGLEVGFDEESAVVVHVLSEGSYKAQRINDGTRVALGEALDEGQRRGYTIRQIVDGVADDEFVGLNDVIESYYEGRPETIAVTQAMWSTNMGSTAAYRSNGIERVEMHDGTEHEPCASRNGAVVTVGQAEAANNNEHTHGTLTLAPVLA